MKYKFLSWKVGVFPHKKINIFLFEELFEIINRGNPVIFKLDLRRLKNNKAS